jgi:hypothetical protein
MGTGWVTTMPDFRDYTMEHPNILPMVQKLGLAPETAPTLPPGVDLRNWCLPIENQGIGHLRPRIGSNKGLINIDLLQRRRRDHAAF